MAQVSLLRELQRSNFFSLEIKTHQVIGGFFCLFATELNFITQIRRAFGSIMLLPQELRVKTYAVQISCIFSAILDIIGLGSMVPILMLAIDNNFLDKSSKLRYIYALLGFQSEANFLIFLLIVIFCFFLIKNVFALWIQRLTTKIASEANIYLSENAYDHAFKSVTYSKTTQEGLGFSDQLIFNPYYYISGVFLPLLLIISEGSVTLLMIALFGVFKQLCFFH